MAHKKTSNLKLEMPTEGSFGWHTSWYNNFNSIDQHPGVLTCTSSTRPSTPWAGQVIFETDTLLLKVFSGSAWIDISSDSSPSSDFLLYALSPSHSQFFIFSFSYTSGLSLLSTTFLDTQSFSMFFSPSNNILILADLYNTNLLSYSTKNGLPNFSLNKFVEVIPFRDIFLSPVSNFLFFTYENYPSLIILEITEQGDFNYKNHNDLTSSFNKIRINPSGDKLILSDLTNPTCYASSLTDFWNPSPFTSIQTEEIISNIYFIPNTNLVALLYDNSPYLSIYSSSNFPNLEFLYNVPYAFPIQSAVFHSTLPYCFIIEPSAHILTCLDLSESGFFNYLDVFLTTFTFSSILFSPCENFLFASTDSSGPLYVLDVSDPENITVAFEYPITPPISSLTLVQP